MIRVSVLLVVALLVLWLFVARPMFSEIERGPAGMELSPADLKEHVTTLSRTFAPRDFRHPGNLDKAARYIADHFRAAGAEVYEQPYDCHGVIYKNIIAEFGPESDSVTIVGAHYDAVEGTPGADDNGSGVAGLLELARMLSDASLSSRVVLAAYALEEPPFFKSEYMGSMVHARSLREKGVRVRLMICFEMIGYFTDEPGSQQFPVPFLKLFYPSRGNFIGIVDQLFSLQAGRLKKWMRSQIKLPVCSINAPGWLPGVDWSDHGSFWKNGYPAVMITDTAFYRYSAYHGMADTADRLDYDKMAQVVYGIFTYVLHLANDINGGGS